MPGGCSASTPSSGSAPQGMDGGPAAAMTLRRQPPNGQTKGSWYQTVDNVPDVTAVPRLEEQELGLN